MTWGQVLGCPRVWQEVFDVAGSPMSVMVESCFDMANVVVGPPTTILAWAISLGIELPPMMNSSAQSCIRTGVSCTGG
jgi:hypothetical protein